jgi:hypothetical protein
MFRSRFSDHFPPKLAHIGPQDLERGVQQSIPTKEVEGVLCALLGLVLNRKKPVEYVCPFTLDSDQMNAIARVRNCAPRRMSANNTTGTVTMVARSRKQCRVTSPNGL